MSNLIGRCANCRHAQHGESGAFDNVVVNTDVTRDLSHRFPLFCARAEMADGLPEDPQTLAVTMDRSTHGASLLVSPDFGCVMFEAKQ